VRRIAVILSSSVVVLALTGSSRSAVGPATLQERFNLGVVAIDARIGRDRVRSSGTVINADDGLVLTSAHTVWGATSLKVSTALGVLHGRIVARAPCDGLALVETQPRIPGLASMTAAPDAPPPPGALLTAVGRRRAHPDAGASSLLTIPTRAAAVGVRARTDPRLPPLAGAIRLDGPLVPEASGGPIVDREGRLVGLAEVAGARRVGVADVAVPWSAVRMRLEALRFGPRRIYVGWRDQYRCAGRLHAYARARHPGYRRGDARLNAPVPATRLPGTEELDG
jgi:S1-C subfamily serine protease